MPAALHGSLVGFESGLEQVGTVSPETSARFTLVARKGGALRPSGTLTLRVERGDPVVVIEVEQEVGRLNGGALRSRATIEASTDSVCSLRSWVLDTVAVDARGREQHDTRLVEHAKVKAREIKWTGADAGAPERSARPVTCDWTWLHAFGELAKSEDSGLHHVDVLEHLTVMRRLVRVQPAGRANVAGHRLRVWRMWGPGLLPRHAWLNEDGQLVAVVGLQTGWFRRGRIP